MTTSDFESDQNEHAADYIDTFISVFPLMAIPPCEMSPALGYCSIDLGGTEVIYNPDISVRRTTRKNTSKLGGIFLRYAKGKELPAKAAECQSAFAFGFLKEIPFEPGAEPEKKLCMTIDGYSGQITEAPGNSIYLFKEMTAVCADIAGLWSSIEPPADAVI